MIHAFIQQLQVSLNDADSDLRHLMGASHLRESIGSSESKRNDDALFSEITAFLSVKGTWMRYFAILDGIMAFKAEIRDLRSVSIA
jgi:hypothetical protein